MVTVVGSVAAAVVVAGVVDVVVEGDSVGSTSALAMGRENCRGPLDEGAEGTRGAVVFKPCAPCKCFRNRWTCALALTRTTRTHRPKWSYLIIKDMALNVMTQITVQGRMESWAGPEIINRG